MAEVWMWLALKPMAQSLHMKPSGSCVELQEALNGHFIIG
jgi:hypothetical protein